MSEKVPLTFKRILLKLSGESLQDPAQQRNLDAGVIQQIALQLKQVISRGIQLSIVVGGGNIYRGIAGASRGIERATGDHMGMLGTVINALALQAIFEQNGVDTRVMTAIRMPYIAEPFIRRRAIRHMEKGRVVIFGAGTGNPYFTTDSAAALRASEIGADVLIKATKVDGVYDKDPKKYKDAHRFEQLTYQEALNRQLGVMDAAAFSLCMENNIPIIVFDFFQPGALLKLLDGDLVGTLVHA